MCWSNWCCKRDESYFSNSSYQYLLKDLSLVFLDRSQHYCSLPFLCFSLHTCLLLLNFDWAAVWDLVKCVGHALLVLVCFLETLHKLRLFKLKLFRICIRVHSFFLLLINSVMITALEILQIHIVHGVKMRLCTILDRLDLLVLMLLFHEEALVVFWDEVVDASLLRFHVIVRAAVWEEVAFKALVDTAVSTCSLGVEAGSARVLDIFQKCSMVRHAGKSVLLFFILTSSEVLETFEITNSFRGTFLILTQFDDSALNLLFLVIHTLW